MSLVAKLTGGKGVNFPKRYSYTARAQTAVISPSRGPSWHLNVLYKHSGHVGLFSKKVLFSRKGKTDQQ
nr:unnamed protein product [Callosobruchus analis]